MADKRLLAKEEITKSLEGIVFDHEPSPSEQDYLDARLDEYKAVSQAQAKLTLQEVGEWLERNEVEVITQRIWKEMIKTFQRGEMPE